MVRMAILQNLLYWLSYLHTGGATCPRFRVGVQADTWDMCWRMDSDELEARLGAGPDGPLDIKDDIGIAESERELPELIDQDSDGNI